MLGDDYSGAWTDETHLAITVIIPAQRPPEAGLAYGWLRGTTVPGASQLRNSLVSAEHPLRSLAHPRAA